MDGLNMRTHDIVDEIIKRIGEIFPNCLTELRNESLVGFQPNTNTVFCGYENKTE